MVGIIRAAVACLSLIAASPVAPSSKPAEPTEQRANIPIPVDTIARTKFPKENPELIDALAAINDLVNRSIQGQDDLSHYGISELWVMYPEDGRGDCEDYALTKMGILSQNGFPTVSNARITGVYVHSRKGVEGHAILELMLPHGSVLIMDNLNAEPMTRAELEARGYEFFDWRSE